MTTYQVTVKHPNWTRASVAGVIVSATKPSREAVEDMATAWMVTMVAPPVVRTAAEHAQNVRETLRTNYSVRTKAV